MPKSKKEEIAEHKTDVFIHFAFKMNRKRFPMTKIMNRIAATKKTSGAIRSGRYSLIQRAATAGTARAIATINVRRSSAIATTAEVSTAVRRIDLINVPARSVSMNGNEIN